MKISKKRMEQDEKELEHFGLCSTQIYVSYKEFIHNKLKLLMVDLVKWCEKKPELMKKLDIDTILFEKYKLIWTQLEPKMMDFYTEIQNILGKSLEAIVAPRSSMNESLMAIDAAYDADIEDLEADLITERYYVVQLKSRLQQLNKCEIYKKQLDSTLKLHQKVEDRFQTLEKIDNKEDEEFWSGFDKNAINRIIALDITSSSKPLMRRNKAMQELENLSKEEDIM